MQDTMAGLGLYNYKARMYDPLLGRFLSADTVTPGGPEGLNRYSYVNNSPVNFNDPTGHMAAQFSDGAGWYEDEDEHNPSPPLPTSQTSSSNSTPSYYDPFTADGYQKGWENFRTATSICGNQNAGAGARAFSCGYVWVWGSAHVVVVGGIAISFAELVLPGGIACASTPNCGDKVINTATRVFYSGGDVAKNAAIEWAANNNGITITDTPGGANLEIVTKGMDWITQAKPLWDAESETYAAGASGIVHVFLNSSGYNPLGIWLTIEYPTLMLNNNVTGIIPHWVP
jgi:RHS repeat-associated protein